MNDQSAWFIRTALKPEKAKSIMDKIQASAEKLGVRAFAVGGYVRDELVGREPKDLDIMAEGKGAGIKLSQQVAKDYDLHEPVIFPRFGTAQIMMEDEQVEFVSPRKEHYTEESRKPDTEAGTLEEDAKRRDFTINALFKDLATGEILDLTGRGKKDIEDKIIRVTDPANADVIFEQDPLRMLRAIRQSLALGFEIEEGTMEALRRNVDRLDIISKERVRDELNKVLTGPRASEGIHLLQDTGLMKKFMPDYEGMVGVTQETRHHDKDVEKHTLSVMDAIEEMADHEGWDKDKRHVLMLAALLHDIGKPAAKEMVDDIARFHGHHDISAEVGEKILRDLKYPNDLIKKVIKLVGLHMKPHMYKSEWGDAAIRRYVREIGEELDDALDLAYADIQGGSPETREEKEEKHEEFRERVRQVQEEEGPDPREMKPVLDGNELMEMFGQSGGPWIKEVTDFLMEKQLENPNLSKDEASEMAKNQFPQHMKGQEPEQPEENSTSSWLLSADKLPGGLADDEKPEDFDPAALAKGIKVELEHTTDKTLAREIAMDHLYEDKNYYDKLEKMESSAWILEAAKYEFSSTQINMPSEVAGKLLDVGKNIPDEDLYDPEAGEDERSYGREEEAHVTVKFGLHTKDAKEVQELLKDFGTINLRIKGISMFENPDKDYDVVKFDIESGGLHELNDFISDNLENTDDFPEYKPHMTIAYVKSGTGKNYTDDSTWAQKMMEKLKGVEIEADSIKFSNPDGEKVDISLGEGRRSEARTQFIPKVIASEPAADILIGTSGFSYNHWKGEFYPESLPGRERLAYYATKFSTVEISSTFHNFPEPRVLRRWDESTPSGFIISLRGPHEATHVRHLHDCGDIMSAFARRAEILGDKLGPITFQLLESEPFDADVLRAFAKSLPSGFKYSLEFRSEPWYTDETFDILSKYNIASVIVSHSNMGVHTRPASKWSHIRMSGNNPDYKLNTYSEEELMNWRGIIADAAKPTYVYFNNEYKAFAAKNALTLMNLMGVEWAPTVAGYDPKIYGPSDGATGPNHQAVPVDERTYGPDNQVEPVRQIKPNDPWAKRPRRYKQQYPSYDPDQGTRVDKPSEKGTESPSPVKPSSY